MKHALRMIVRWGVPLSLVLVGTAGAAMVLCLWARSLTVTDLWRWRYVRDGGRRHLKYDLTTEPGHLCLYLGVYEWNLSPADVGEDPDPVLPLSHSTSPRPSPEEAYFRYLWSSPEEHSGTPGNGWRVDEYKRFRIYVLRRETRYITRRPSGTFVRWHRVHWEVDVPDAGLVLVLLVPAAVFICSVVPGAVIRRRRRLLGASKGSGVFNVRE